MVVLALSNLGQSVLRSMTVAWERRRARVGRDVGRRGRQLDVAALFVAEAALSRPPGAVVRRSHATVVLRRTL